jgi:hypothetical protein
MSRHRPLQRVAFALLLVCISSAALAKNAVLHEAATADSGSSNNSSDAQEPDATAASLDKIEQTRAAAPPTNPVRYAKPAAAPVVRNNDVDGSEVDVMPRAYFGKWHSFLPGMFR